MMDQFSKSKKKSSILSELNLSENNNKKNKNEHSDTDGYGYMLPLLKNLKSQSIESESPSESINAVIFC